MEVILWHTSVEQRGGDRYRCTFGRGLMGWPEARKKHGTGTTRPEMF
jgi:hypothetical protein